MTKFIDLKSVFIGSLLAAGAFAIYLTTVPLHSACSVSELPFGGETVELHQVDQQGEWLVYASDDEG